MLNSILAWVYTKLLSKISEALIQSVVASKRKSWWFQPKEHKMEANIVKQLLSVSLLLKISMCYAVDKLLYQNCSAILEKQGGSVKNEYGKSKCPPWFSTDQRGACQPGPELGGIIQQDMSTLQTSVSECSCMTEENGTLSVGACTFTCTALRGYYPLPCHVTELQNVTCAPFNRRGHLCGQCMEGHAIPVYSYDLHCVKCEDNQYNWLKYLAVAFLPLTLFYIVVTLFSISFTSPLLSGVVLLFQITTNPIQISIFVSLMEAGLIVAPEPLKIALSLASVWNLDFFRLYYSFCLYPNASEMTITSLEYALAVYPVFLIVLTYVMVKLYDHNITLLVWLWKPFQYIRKPLKRQWNTSTSLVDVFASFIYLSSTRLVLTSMKFLLPTTVCTTES